MKRWRSDSREESVSRGKKQEGAEGGWVGGWVEGGASTWAALVILPPKRQLTYGGRRSGGGQNEATHWTGTPARHRVLSPHHRRMSSCVVLLLFGLEEVPGPQTRGRDSQPANQPGTDRHRLVTPFGPSFPLSTPCRRSAFDFCVPCHTR